MTRRLALCLCVAAMATVASACSPSAPLTPTPLVSTEGSPAIGTTLKVTAPAPQSPANGQTLANTTLTGLLMAAGGAVTEYGVPMSLQYEFELLDANGSVIERSGARSGPTWAQQASLNFESLYQWRVRALSDEHVGPWSPLSSFRTRNLPDHFRCGPPFHSDPLSIILCHRALFGGLGHDELPLLLKRVARDFNRAGVEDGPFGILWKRQNNNCHGYSCDILCAGQGNSQKQWDILLDESIPVWSGSDLDNIRTDFCEIQPSELVDVAVN